MTNKQVVTIVAGCIVCIMCGFALGYMTGSGILPAGSLSGSGMPRGSMPMSGQDMSTQMMQMQMERAGMLNQQLSDMMAQMNERNNEIKKIQDMISQLRSIASGANDVDIDPIRQYCTENGIVFPAVSDNGTLTKGEAESLIAALQDRLDSLNTVSQTDMMKLQSLMNKRNQAFEMMSNTIQKNQQTRDNIISNIR